MSNILSLDRCAIREHQCSPKELEELRLDLLASIMKVPVDAIRHLDQKIINIFKNHATIQNNGVISHLKEPIQLLYQHFSFEELIKLPPTFLKTFFCSPNSKNLKYLNSFPNTSFQDAIALLFNFDKKKTCLYYQNLLKLHRICSVFNLSLQDFLAISTGFEENERFILNINSRNLTETLSILNDCGISFKDIIKLPKQSLENLFQLYATSPNKNLCKNKITVLSNLPKTNPHDFLTLLFNSNIKNVKLFYNYNNNLHLICSTFNISLNQFVNLLEPFKDHTQFILSYAELLCSLKKPDVPFEKIFHTFIQTSADLGLLKTQKKSNELSTLPTSPKTNIEKLVCHLASRQLRNSKFDVANKLIQQHKGAANNSMLNAILSLLIESSIKPPYLETASIQYIINLAIFIRKILKNDTSQKRVDCVQKKLKKLDANNENFDILLPTGWSGHTVICGLHKSQKTNSYSFSIWNTGDGLENNHHQLEGKYQIRAVWSDLTFEQINDPVFLNWIFEIKTQKINPQTFYDYLDNHFNKSQDPPSKNPLDYHKDQAAFNCVWKAFWASFADILGRETDPILAWEVKSALITSALNNLEKTILAKNQNTFTDELLISKAEQMYKNLQKRITSHKTLVLEEKEVEIQTAPQSVSIYQAIFNYMNRSISSTFRFVQP